MDSGIYYENVNVTKRLILRGIGQPVVDANGSGNAITLAADGIVLEGFTAIRGSNGIEVRSNNNMLRGNNASSYGYGVGISLSSSSDNTLIGNVANSRICEEYYCWGGTGILLTSSSNNKLIGNDASDNENGILLEESSNNNTLINNNANRNYAYGLWECFGTGISLYSSSNNTLSGNNANSNCEYGISLASSSDNMLTSNNANENRQGGDWMVAIGISLSSSSNNTLIGNNANENWDVGISLSSSSNNTLIGNNANENCWMFEVCFGVGIYRDPYSYLNGPGFSSNNMLMGNNATNNNFGIVLESSKQQHAQWQQCIEKRLLRHLSILIHQ